MFKSVSFYIYDWISNKYAKGIEQRKYIWFSFFCYEKYKEPENTIFRYHLVIFSLFFLNNEG